MNDTLKYPVLFVHGFGFRDGEKRKYGYWGRIPKFFTDKGCKVYFGNQDASGSIESNAFFLQQKIFNILKENNCDKINVIAHSKGGLDIRYLISTLNMGNQIASLTTIATPHHGNKVLRWVPKFILWFIALFVNLWMHLIGDNHPNTYKSFLCLRSDYAKQFNINNPDDENVYYQSYTTIMKRDFMFVLPHLILKLFLGDNDGLVTVESAQWGEFKGVYKSNSKRGISHGDQVDARKKKFTDKTGDNLSDILELYEMIYNDLVKLKF